MVKVKSLFISDTHLGVKHNNSKDFLKVLNEYEAENIFLVGDIIDFVALEKNFNWKPKDSEIILKLLSLSNISNIVWLTGNHENVLRQFTPFDFGKIKFLDEFIYKDYLIIHGDRFDSLIYNKKWLYTLGNFSYDTIINIDDLFNFKGKLSKKIKKKVKRLSTYLNDFYESSISYAKSRGCNSVICGHLHHQEVKITLDFKYFNCGNFREDKDFAIENLNGGIELISL